MSTVCRFDTQSVRSWSKPQLDTFAGIIFNSFVAPPRLPVGFRQLDIGNNANIRAKRHFQFLTGEHMRNLISDPKSPASTRIYFQRPFVTPPKVVVFFNYIDLDKNHNWRLKTTATDIDVHGFTLNIETWHDTILYAAQAGWVAYPEDKPHIFSASVNTQEFRASQLEQSKNISFGDVEFWKDPNVFVAWNTFDIDCGAGFRLNMYADNVTQHGLTWHINVWANTVLYSAGATIIAVN